MLENIKQTIRQGGHSCWVLGAITHTAALHAIFMHKTSGMMLLSSSNNLRADLYIGYNRVNDFEFAEKL